MIKHPMHMPEMPPLKMIRQSETVPPALSGIASAVEGEFEKIRKEAAFAPGASIAVAVGSRGIANLPSIVRTVVSLLKAAGGEPFITPAMGSHGGANAEGQVAVLAARGISRETVGAPVRATMDVDYVGEVDGIPLHIDRLANTADGIVLINRIKPHTNFIGKTESGLIKMMAIGLGNQIGAEHYHRLSLIKDQYKIISCAGRNLINECRVLFGVGILENQKHQTMAIKMATSDRIEAAESELLKKARALLPSLPLEEIDLLVVDEMGKDISGEGIDPNVVGRDVCAYGARRPLPVVTRIFVRDLTEASEGSAVGVGQADFTTRRLVEKIDFDATAANCLTACCPEAGKIPLTYTNDRDAIAAALKTLRPYVIDDLRIVHIRNTMKLRKMIVSIGCLDDLTQHPEIEIQEESLAFAFDGDGFLRSCL